MKVPKTMKQKFDHGFESRVIDLLDKEYGVVSGDKIKRLFAQEIARLAKETIIEAETLEMGQISWYGVDIQDKPTYGKNAGKTLYKPVTLDLITEEDLTMAAEGFSYTERRKQKIIRLFENAYEQGAVLTHADVAFLLHVSTGTVGKDVKEYMTRTNKIVHTRGIVHDIGPSITHKKIIVTLWYKGYLEPEIARITDHSEEAVHRYIKAAQRVELAMETNDDPKKIGRLLGMSEKLVEQYTAIIKEVKDNDN